MNPWIGVALIALGVGGMVGFGFLHMQDTAALVGIVTIGVTIVQGAFHAKATKENAMLKCSLRNRNPDEVQR